MASAWSELGSSAGTRRRGVRVTAGKQFIRHARRHANTIKNSTGISACSKGKQCQPAFTLRSEMREAQHLPDVKAYNISVNARGKG
ncbi:unnamed protein product [Prorocentrum cordatum]|uniref:Uncharacterized protein n=1 Tax=Prorocentrum cordatum TaxID=2364126 RepID=A0ABN9SU63_9DINO|nr:unnamed protein product [Polarella glacialis]